MLLPVSRRSDMMGFPPSRAEPMIVDPATGRPFAPLRQQLYFNRTDIAADPTSHLIGTDQPIYMGKAMRADLTHSGASRILLKTTDYSFNDPRTINLVTTPTSGDVYSIEYWSETPIFNDSAFLTSDAYFNSVVYLAHGEALSDVKGHSLTNTGGVSLDTSIFKYGTGSLAFAGSGGLRTDLSNDFYFAGNDYTLECWMYCTDFSLDGSTQRRMMIITDGSGNHEISLSVDASNHVNWYTYEGGAYQTGTGGPKASTGTFLTNTWYFVSYTRASNVHYLHVGGVNQGSFTYSGSMNNSTYYCVLGTAEIPGTGRARWKGNLDEIRVTKGVARYGASNYTPPIGPFANQ